MEFLVQSIFIFPDIFLNRYSIVYDVLFYVLSKKREMRLTNSKVLLGEKRSAKLLKLISDFACP